MIVFTVIGIIVCALVALVIVVCALFAAMSGRVKIGKFQPTTWLRRYRVFLPGEGFGNSEALALCWTWWGAKRVAKRKRGTRIQDRWSGSVVVARSGWSESSNGYRDPSYDRPSFG